MEITFKVTKDITIERVAGLLCCALEGGSGYWSQVDFEKSTKPPEINPEIKKEWGEFRHISWPLSEGGHLCLFDIEDEKDYFLDLAAIERGLRLMADKHPRHFGDFISENDDAETGDVFLQCCVLGELVYG